MFKPSTDTTSPAPTPFHRPFSFTHRRRIARPRRWCSSLLSLFFPEVCQICRNEPAPARLGYIGTRCRTSLHSIVPPFCHVCGLPFTGPQDALFQCENCAGQTLHFQSARALFRAQSAGRELIHSLKYHRAFWLAPLFQRRIRSSPIDLLRPSTPWNAIVPIPLHRLKLRERGYNQAALVATWVSQHLHTPLHLNWLERSIPTPSQTTLTRHQRAQNVAQAFQLTPHCPPQPGRILIVDDVLTTGATASACALQLRKAGATEVHVFTLARGI